MLFNSNSYESDTDPLQSHETSFIGGKENIPLRPLTQQQLDCLHLIPQNMVE